MIYRRRRPDDEASAEIFPELEGAPRSPAHAGRFDKTPAGMENNASRKKKNGDKKSKG